MFIIFIRQVKTSIYICKFQHTFFLDVLYEEKITHVETACL
jgi:hypothetical protein